MSRRLPPLFACIVALSLVVTGCAGKPWTAESFTEFQRKHYAHVQQRYPVGASRAELLARAGVKHNGEPDVTSFALPLNPDDPKSSDYRKVKVIRLAQFAREATGQEPARVDVLMASRGFMALGLEEHFVFYGADDRVIAAYGLILD